MRNASLGILSFTHRKWVKAVIFGLFVCLLVLGISFVPGTGTGTAQAACTTYTNIRAVDEGGGTWNDRKYFLYVYSTTNGNGTTYYYYDGGMLFGWVKTDWQAVDLTPDKKGVKIGVSTLWAYKNWPWTSKKYKYVLC